MVGLNNFSFAFLKKNEIRELQIFLQKNWKPKQHILAKSKKFLLWQHLSKKKFLDFYICKHNGKIISVIGIINFANSKRYKEIGLSMWISNIKFRYIGGLLFKNFLNKFPKSEIVATGLNEVAIKYYKYFNFNIAKFEKYYVCPNDSRKQIITKNLKKTINSKLNLSKLKTVNFREFYKIVKNKKKISSFKRRFEKHPVYKHFVLKDERFKIYFIVRSVSVLKFKFLRILDYFGSFENTNLAESFSRYCLDKRFHHVEFLHYGSEKKKILKSGFNILDNKNSIMPILTEPYMGLKESNIIIAYKNLKNIKIVKGDVDADRPHNIR
tara:strand:- start:22784 stop:23758 length:975 start_codon:yes stop_codon:yes gene_type:complete